jgi:hypothetical protein
MKLKGKDRKNILAVLIFFLAGHISFNYNMGVVFHSLGLAFFIAFFYGIVVLSKKKGFIF